MRCVTCVDFLVLPSEKIDIHTVASSARCLSTQRIIYRRLDLVCRYEPPASPPLMRLYAKRHKSAFRSTVFGMNMLDTNLLFRYCTATQQAFCLRRYWFSDLSLTGVPPNPVFLELQGAHRTKGIRWYKRLFLAPTSTPQHMRPPDTSRTYGLHAGQCRYAAALVSRDHPQPRPQYRKWPHIRRVRITA